MKRILIVIGILLVPIFAVSQNIGDSTRIKKASPCADRIKPNPDKPPLVFVVLKSIEYPIEKKDQKKVMELADFFESVEILACKKDLVQYNATENGVILIHPKRKHYRAFRKIVKKEKTAPNNM